MGRNKLLIGVIFGLLVLTAGGIYISKLEGTLPDSPAPTQNIPTENPFVSRFVKQVVFYPGKPGLLFTIVVEQGIFRSLDNGKTWSHISQEIGNLVIYQLLVNPDNPDHLYAGTFGAGVYQSLNGGMTWNQTNTGLTNTSIESLSFHPGTPDVLYLATTAGGFFKSIDQGNHWFLYNAGLPDWDHNHGQTFIAFSGSGTLSYANYEGLFHRTETEPTSKKMETGWKQVEIAPEDSAVTYYFKDRLSGNYYLTTQAGNFYKSADGIKWTHVGDQLKEFAVYDMIVNPLKPDNLFIAGGRNGVLESTDHGASWTPARLPPPDHDVRVLTQDPIDPARLFIGTAKKGLWTTEDGGIQWKRIESLPLLDWALLMEDLPSRKVAVDEGNAENGKMITASGLPASFTKCNRCHGWTEPSLNSNPHTFWYVTPTPRNWEITVNRMAEKSNLEPGEDTELINYMNEHYGL